jgi:hypothetical protein
LVAVTVHWSGGAATADPVATWRALQGEAMSGHNVNATVHGDIEYNAGITDARQIFLGRRRQLCRRALDEHRYTLVGVRGR